MGKIDGTTKRRLIMNQSLRGRLDSNISLMLRRYGRMAGRVGHIGKRGKLRKQSNLLISECYL